MADERSVRTGDLIRGIELDGYAVLPNVASEEQTQQVRTDLDALELDVATYSSAQVYRHDVQWQATRAVFDLIGCQPVLDFLSILFGDDLVFVSATYARTDPGYGGMALHTDGQPYGSNIFGMRGSCPVAVRVSFYLDDLTLDCAPLRVVPSSHLGLHYDANPYRRYLRHPDEVQVTCSARSAILINHRVFHAVGPNRSTRSRAVLAVCYRPSWAGPIRDLQPYTGKQLALIPDDVRPLFADPNTRVDNTIPNWATTLPTSATGLGTKRWGGP